MSRLFFSPVSVWMLIVLVLLIIIGLPLLFFGIIGAAFANLGLGFWVIAGLIIACIVGSFINIPITTLYPKKEKIEEEIPEKPKGQYAPSMYDKMYNTDRFVSCCEPKEEKRGTQISLNVGGALIPILVSCYVLVMACMGKISADPWYLVKIIGATVLVTITAYIAARPVKGIGVAIPFIIPPAVTLIIALILGGGFGLPAAGIAYFAGTMGVLIGGDLLHLRKVTDENTPMLSIGGAGTFDGIFLTGVLTALLASIF